MSLAQFRTNEQPINLYAHHFKRTDVANLYTTTLERPHRIKVRHFRALKLPFRIQCKQNGVDRR